VEFLGESDRRDPVLHRVCCLRRIVGFKNRKSGPGSLILTPDGTATMTPEITLITGFLLPPAQKPLLLLRPPLRLDLVLRRPLPRLPLHTFVLDLWNQAPPRQLSLPVSHLNQSLLSHLGAEIGMGWTTVLVVFTHSPPLPRGDVGRPPRKAGMVTFTHSKITTISSGMPTFNMVLTEPELSLLSMLLAVQASV